MERSAPRFRFGQATRTGRKTPGDWNRGWKRLALKNATNKPGINMHGGASQGQNLVMRNGSNVAPPERIGPPVQKNANRGWVDFGNNGNIWRQPMRHHGTAQAPDTRKTTTPTRKAEEADGRSNSNRAARTSRESPTERQTPQPEQLAADAVTSAEHGKRKLMATKGRAHCARSNSEDEERATQERGEALGSRQMAE